MDVIALHQAGFTQAVASLGTALTENQCRLLARYTKKVLLTYDSDAAGTNAALRAIPMLKEAGLSVAVINMKPYKDPDEFIKALGAEAFEERINQAVNSFLFEIEVIERRYDFKDPESKTAFFKATAKKLLEFREGSRLHNDVEFFIKNNISALVLDNLRLYILTGQVGGSIHMGNKSYSRKIFATFCSGNSTVNIAHIIHESVSNAESFHFFHQISTQVFLFHCGRHSVGMSIGFGVEGHIFQEAFISFHCCISVSEWI
jgi:5S rRNA maturation endonuclease (ribonuclease M5)